MSTIYFETVLRKIGDWTLLRLPENASAQLPSRGMALVEGNIKLLKPSAALYWRKPSINLDRDGSDELGGLRFMIFSP